MGHTVNRRPEKILFLILKKNRTLFGPDHPNVADEYCDKLAQSIGMFAESSTPESLRKSGTVVLLKISELNSILKPLLEDWQSRIH